MKSIIIMLVPVLLSSARFNMKLLFYRNNFCCQPKTICTVIVVLLLYKGQSSYVYENTLWREYKHERAQISERHLKISYHFLWLLVSIFFLLLILLYLLLLLSIEHYFRCCAAVATSLYFSMSHNICLFLGNLDILIQA